MVVVFLFFFFKDFWITCHFLEMVFDDTVHYIKYLSLITDLLHCCF